MSDVEQHPITTLAEARASGALTYFSGKPCPMGHIALRRTRKSRCVVCWTMGRRKLVPLDAEPLEELRRLWTTTRDTAAQVSEFINSKFGTLLSPQDIAMHAKREQFVRRPNPPKAKGRPSKFTPEVLEELERMWTTTDMANNQIAEVMSKRFGIKLSGTRLREAANKQGFVRQSMPVVLAHPKVIDEQLRTLAFMRWDKPAPPADNLVRRVPPGTHRTAGGFSMLRRAG
jgi:hypothetical protein